MGYIALFIRSNLVLDSSRTTDTMKSEHGPDRDRTVHERCPHGQADTSLPDDDSSERDERRSVPISPARARCRRHNRGAKKAIDVRRVAARASSFHLPPPLLHCPSPRRRGQVQLSLRTRSHGGLLGSNCGRRRRRKSSLPRSSCWVVHLGHRERPRLSRFLVAIGCWDTVIDLLVLNFVFSEA